MPSNASNSKNLNISYFSSTSEDYEPRQIILVGDLIGRLDATGKILDYGSNAQKAIINEISSRDFNDLVKLDLLDMLVVFH